MVGFLANNYLRHFHYASRHQNGAIEEDGEFFFVDFRRQNITLLTLLPTLLIFVVRRLINTLDSTNC